LGASIDGFWWFVESSGRGRWGLVAEGASGVGEVRQVGAGGGAVDAGVRAAGGELEVEGFGR
jgi:hypothetical protein